jgi:hypothetical protein
MIFNEEIMLSAWPDNTASSYDIPCVDNVHGRYMIRETMYPVCTFLHTGNVI